MIKSIHIQETELWEAWIEYDQFNPDQFGTLYVHGEISANVKTTKHLFQVRYNPLHKKELSLHIQAPIGKKGGRKKEVVYSQPIVNLNQYASIAIYAGEELLLRINEIEVMI